MQNINPKLLAFQEKLKDVKSIEELIGKNGLITDLFKDTIQTMMEAELTNQLGYPKNMKILSPGGSNKRNGSYNKKIRTSFGETQIDVPRDRNGDFEPQIIPKHQSNTNELERKIISMYGKGMTVSDLNEHLADMYGIEVTDPMISQITDKIIPQIQEWQTRRLERVYPIAYLDAIHFKIRDEGTVSTKAAYIVLGVDVNGKKDILGMWIGEEEGAKFWLSVLTELNSRGVEDILIACCDNLSGFTEAIGSIFPKTIIQKCVVHQIRNSLKYIVSKDQKAFLTDLKKVYRADTRKEAEHNLLELDGKWGKKYPLVIKSWENNWAELSAYFEYCAPIRKIIYTTNAIEGLNRQIRKVTKSKSVFPTRTSLEKILFLAARDIMKRWSGHALANWAQTVSQLAIHFPDRIRLSL
jgi:transposase-like protein